MFQLGTGEDSNLHEYYEFIAGSSALNRREMDLHKRAWVQSLTNDAKEIPEEGVSDLELAKTWSAPTRRRAAATARQASASTLPRTVAPRPMRRCRWHIHAVN
jgi:hypothetical protein